MSLLYSLLFIMLLLSLGLLAIPFVKNRKNHPNQMTSFFILGILTGVFTFGLYQFSGNKPALTQWFTQGSEHYRLQTQVAELGGINGIIKSVQKKLDKNPNDAQGWLILGKLYRGIHDDKSAAVAFKKAHDLDPDNTEINHYYVNP